MINRSLEKDLQKIGVMKRRGVCVLAIAACLSAMSACGQQTETDAVVAEAETFTETVSSVEEESLPGEETEESAQEENLMETETETETETEVMIAYMDQIGANFDLEPEKSFVLHTFNSDTEATRERQDFETDFIDVAKFYEGDGFAGVEDYHYETVTFFIHANESGQGVNFNAYVCDYYTGAILSFEGSKDVSDEMRQALEDSSFVVTANGEEYSVTGISDFQRIDDGWKLTFTALVPDGYDGICYGIGSSVIDEEKGEADEETEEETLITDGDFRYKPETWHFYRFE